MADAVEDTKQMGPAPTSGFGPREVADAFRMAQQKTADDAISDVDMNSVFAREQGGTLVLMGKNFEAGASRRNAIFDLIAGRVAAKDT